MSLALAQAPTLANATEVPSRNGLRLRAWIDEPNLLTCDVNLTVATSGGALRANLSVQSARELAAALLLCADAVEVAA